MIPMNTDNITSIVFFYFLWQYRGTVYLQDQQFPGVFDSRYYSFIGNLSFIVDSNSNI